MSWKNYKHKMGVEGLKSVDKPWESSFKNPEPGCTFIMSKIISLDLRGNIYMM